MLMSDWKRIMVFTFPQEAYTAKAYLESEGIEVFLQDEMTTQVFNFYSNAIGGVKMLVPDEQVNKAINLLIEGGYLTPTE